MIGRGGGASEEPFMVLLGRGDCRLLVVREAFEVTKSASVGTLLLFRLKRPIFAMGYG